MAKKKHRRRRTHTAAPVHHHRRRRAHLSSPRRRKRRSSHLGDLPMIGKIGLENPFVGGGIGGAGAMVVKKLIPENMIPASWLPYMKWVKGAAILGGAFLAKRAGKPMIAAGLTGAAVALAMTDAGVLSDDAFTSAKYVNPNLLSGRKYNVLDEATGETYLLSEAEMRAIGDPQLLSDAALLSNYYPNGSGH